MKLILHMMGVEPPRGPGRGGRKRGGQLSLFPPDFVSLLVDLVPAPAIQALALVPPSSGAHGPGPPRPSPGCTRGTQTLYKAPPLPLLAWEESQVREGA